MTENKTEPEHKDGTKLDEKEEWLTTAKRKENVWSKQERSKTELEHNDWAKWDEIKQVAHHDKKRKWLNISRGIKTFNKIKKNSKELTNYIRNWLNKSRGGKNWTRTQWQNKIR